MPNAQYCLYTKKPHLKVKAMQEGHLIMVRPNALNLCNAVTGQHEDTIPATQDFIMRWGCEEFRTPELEYLVQCFVEDREFSFGGVADIYQPQAWPDGLKDFHQPKYPNGVSFDTTAMDPLQYQSREEALFPRKE